MSRYVSPGTTLTILFFLAGLILAMLGFRQYHLHADKPLLPRTEAGERTSVVVLEELRSLFWHAPQPASNYASISEQNMFSPERKPWSPPSQEPAQASPAPDIPVPADSGGIRLYGTTITDQVKMALLYFERFSSRQKHHLVNEGEVVRDEGERGEAVFYRVLSVARDRVELQDARGNDFTIGLYDHERTDSPPPALPPPTVVTQPQARSQAGAQPQPAGQPSQPTGQQTQGGQNPTSAVPAPSKNGVEPLRRMEDMPDSMEEREQLAREGRLRRINTPFGPVYRPVE